MLRSLSMSSVRPSARMRARTAAFCRSRCGIHVPGLYREPRSPPSTIVWVWPRTTAVMLRILSHSLAARSSRASEQAEHGTVGDMGEVGVLDLDRGRLARCDQLLVL